MALARKTADSVMDATSFKTLMEEIFGLPANESGEADIQTRKFLSEFTTKMMLMNPSSENDAKFQKFSTMVISALSFWPSLPLDLLKSNLNNLGHFGSYQDEREKLIEAFNNSAIDSHNKLVSQNIIEGDTKILLLNNTSELSEVINRLIQEIDTFTKKNTEA